MTALPIEVGVTPRAVVALHGVLAACTVALLAGTAVLLQRYRERGPDLALDPFLLQVLAQSNLAVENVLATWYSSMLLLATAAVCVFCFLAEWRRPTSVLRFGWIVLAVVLAGLSWDELGSVHERVQLPSGTVGWLLWFVPFLVAVPGFLLLFAWCRLRRSRWALVYVCVAVALFVTVPVQEFVEVEVMAANAEPGWQRPVPFVVLEEGAELLAVQFLLAGLIRHALDVLGQRRGGRVVLTVTVPGRRTMSALWIAVVGLAAIATHELGRLVPPDPSHGRPENWWPSALAFAAAVVALSAIARARPGRESLSYALLAVLSLLVGAYVGGTVVYDAVRGVLAAGILVATALAVTSLRVTGTRLGAAVWGISALTAVTVSDLLAVRLLLCAAAAGLGLGLLSATGRAAVGSRRSGHRLVDAGSR